MGFTNRILHKNLSALRHRVGRAGVGLDEPSGSLPTPDILWFQDDNQAALDHSRGRGRPCSSKPSFTPICQRGSLSMQTDRQTPGDQTANLGCIKIIVSLHLYLHWTFKLKFQNLGVLNFKLLKFYKFNKFGSSCKFPLSQGIRVFDAKFGTAVSDFQDVIGTGQLAKIGIWAATSQNWCQLRNEEYRNP